MCWRGADSAADLGRDFGATLTEAEVRWLMTHEYARDGGGRGLAAHQAGAAADGGRRSQAIGAFMATRTQQGGRRMTRPKGDDMALELDGVIEGRERPHPYSPDRPDAGAGHDERAAWARRLSGKTSLMRLMAGLDVPTVGPAAVDGQDVTGMRGAGPQGRDGLPAVHQLPVDDGLREHRLAAAADGQVGGRDRPRGARDRPSC